MSSGRDSSESRSGLGICLRHPRPRFLLEGSLLGGRPAASSAASAGASAAAYGLNDSLRSHFCLDLLCTCSRVTTDKQLRKHM
eukprot:6595702-Heterocapsa_arctica.AAC.1